MNIANKLTLSRVIMIPIFIIVLMGNFFPYSRYVATGIFILASFTDYLDGYLARSLNLVTNFGKFLDPLADKLLVSAALICMVELQDLAAWIVVLMISREFIITGFRLVASLDGKVIAASTTAKFKTATQMVMIVLILIKIDNPIFYLLTNLFIILSVVLTVVSATEYIVKNISVFKES